VAVVEMATLALLALAGRAVVRLHEELLGQERLGKALQEVVRELMLHLFLVRVVVVLAQLVV
jgi:hypothetical protein